MFAGDLVRPTKNLGYPRSANEFANSAIFTQAVHSSKSSGKVHANMHGLSFRFSMSSNLSLVRLLVPLIIWKARRDLPSIFRSHQKKAHAASPCRASCKPSMSATAFRPYKPQCNAAQLLYHLLHKPQCRMCNAAKYNAAMYNAGGHFVIKRFAASHPRPQPLVAHLHCHMQRKASSRGGRPRSCPAPLFFCHPPAVSCNSHGVQP